MVERLLCKNYRDPYPGSIPGFSKTKTFATYRKIIVLFFLSWNSIPVSSLIGSQNSVSVSSLPTENYLITVFLQSTGTTTKVPDVNVLFPAVKDAKDDRRRRI